MQVHYSTVYKILLPKEFTRREAFSSASVQFHHREKRGSLLIGRAVGSWVERSVIGGGFTGFTLVCTGNIIPQYTVQMLLLACYSSTKSAVEAFDWQGCR